MKLLETLLLVVYLSCGVYSCCPSGWHRYRGSCYGFSKDLLPWAEAQAVCGGFGGHLAVIETRREGQYLENLARSKGATTYWWLGATDMMNEGVFTWITNGKRVRSYGNWAPSQPDNAAGVEDCLEINGPQGFKWNDRRCQRSLNFICETVERR